MTTAERFEISTQGFRELNEGREPWTLVKELIQNAWDEAPPATICQVTITPGPTPDTTLVQVDDDGPGFSDPTHAYTLMAPTAKRSDPTKRGRFNIGEKEIISLSIWATVETKGTTISFPQTGGRTISPNTRPNGTSITVLMPWNDHQADELAHMLSHFRPTDCALTINGNPVPSRTPTVQHSAILPSVLQSGPGQPLRNTKRRTNIDILEPHDPEGCWLYELGIPVQHIEIAYDVDIHQKVPMPPNRDTVGQAYLQDLAAEVLNALHPIMPPPKFSDTWVRTGIEDDRVTSQAFTTAAEHRYGPKVAMWSSDTDANMTAAENGYQVVHPRSLSTQERTKLKEIVGVQSTHSLFGRGNPPEYPVTPNPDQETFAKWVIHLASFAGMTAHVTFYSSPESKTIADCTSSTTTPIIRFNTAKLPPEWFTCRDADQLAIVIHELAHAHAHTPMEHGPKWGHAAAEVGALIAKALSTLPNPEETP